LSEDCKRKLLKITQHMMNILDDLDKQVCEIEMSEEDKELLRRAIDDAERELNTRFNEMVK
jgi:hypothetical protein